MHNTKFLIYITCILSLNVGCSENTLKRHYKEIVIKPENKTSISAQDPHAFANMMPQDEIHKNLDVTDSKLNQLDTSQMPQDEIHKNINVGDIKFQQQLEASVDKASLQWVTPEGWIEKKGSGMRLATFTSVETANPVEVSVISLGGSAGGLNSNIVRWIKQLNLEVPAEAKLAQFIQTQKRLEISSGLSALILDFSLMQEDMPSNVDSMIVAVIDRGASQVFIKMLGMKQAVINNRAILLTLVQSIETE